MKEEECGAVTVRAWMELWMPVKEYNILNLARWTGGIQEHHFEQSHRLTAHLLCTCPHRSSSVRKHKTDESSHKLLSKVKSVSHFTSKASHISGLKDSEECLSVFVKYVETILKSERRLALHRETLRGHNKVTEQILHEIVSKDKESTKMGHLISVIH